jgi:hypothetical protein
MGLIKKADVKHHLSARHRTEIHLQPESQADAAGFPREDDTGDQNATDPVESSLRIPNPSGPVPTVNASESHRVVVLGQSKSAQA